MCIVMDRTSRNHGSNGEKIAVNTAIATWSGLQDSPVTTDVSVKKQGKTIFTVHQPEKKYLKDYSLCFCVPLEDGYLDNIGFRKLDSVEYVNAAEK